MQVNPATLHQGAAHSDEASEHARNGAAHLERTPPVAGMFGDFGAADVFHQLVSAAHAQHVATLNEHRKTLAAIGDKAHHAGVKFTAMEDANAAEMRAVLP